MKKDKQEFEKRKLDELDSKIDKLQEEKANKQKAMQEEQKEKEDKRGQNNAAFLSNIKSFDVGIEDF